MLQMNMLKKTVDYQFVTKDNDIEGQITSVTGLVNKLQYDTAKQNIEKLIEDVY